MKVLSAASLLAFGFIAGCTGSTTNTTPPAPSAMTWTLQAGASSAHEADQGLQFYTTSITIDAGDSITWGFPAGEPHTVTFLGNRKSLPPPTDPTVPIPAGGSIYDGSTYTSSGFKLLGGSYTLTFPKPGAYKYYCLLHGGLRGGMVGSITVQSAGAHYPRAQKQYTSAAQDMISSDLANAAASINEFPYRVGGTHLAAGIAPKLNTGPPSTSTVVRFLDSKSSSDQSVAIAVGATITWTNLSNNFPHTVTLGVAGRRFPNLPPFSPPSGGTTYDGTVVTNSGPLFPGQSYSLTFIKAGTYTYHCLFHDDTENMIGTVSVR